MIQAPDRRRRIMRYELPTMNGLGPGTESVSGERISV